MASRYARSLLWIVAAVQATLAARVVFRFLRTGDGATIGRATASPRAPVVAIVPVLNEERRLAPCLDGLIAQGPELAAIVVVDGGSWDGTVALAHSYAERDPRVCIVVAGPPPAGWNGKAYNLAFGLQNAPPAPWVLTIDADARPAPGLVAALAAFAEQAGLDALSVAAQQDAPSPGLSLLHPALLTTLVYRYGRPGVATHDPAAVQANGQCMLLRRAALERIGGFALVRDSRCEDVTLARVLARSGALVGFYESDGLLATEMYTSAREAWANWPRSLPLRDRYSGAAGWLGLLEVTLVQALPPLLLPVAWRQRAWPMVGMLIALSAIRVGVLKGTARAYRRRSAVYWLSPVLDLPVAVRLWQSALQRRPPVWRGRRLAR